MKILEEAVGKEDKVRLEREMKVALTASGKAPPVYSRLQVPGEKVTLEGLNRRPQLNGVSGKVVSNGMDDNGFLIVQVPGDTPAGLPSKEGDFRTLKVQPRNLKPVRGPKDGRPRGGGLMELKGEADAISVHTMSSQLVPGSGAGAARSASRASASDGDEARSGVGGRRKFGRAASVPSFTMPPKSLHERGFGRIGNRVTGWAGHF